METLKLANAIRLLSTRNRVFLAASITSGFIWFGAENLFAYSCQLFLKSLGLLNQTSLDKYLDLSELTFFTSAILLIILSSLRAILVSSRQFFAKMSYQIYLSDARQKILSFSKLPVDKYDTSKIQTLFGDVSHNAALYVNYLSLFLISSIATVSFLVFCFYNSFSRTLLGLVLLSILFFPIKKLTKTFHSTGDALLGIYNNLIFNLTLNIRNRLFLKITKKEDEEIQRSNVLIEKYLKKSERQHYIGIVSSSLPQILGVIVIVFLCSPLLDKYFGKVDVLVFFYAFIRMAQSASETVNTISHIKLYEKSFTDLQTSFLESEQLNKKSSQEKKNQEFITQIDSIIFDHVFFSYVPGGEFVIKELSLSLSKGDFLYISGPSGSGKSTFLSLLLGLNPPTKGNILINNESIVGKDLSVAYAGPEPFLIPGSLRENLTYGLRDGQSFNEDYANELIEELELKGLFPEGLDSQILELGGLSTGQRQRIGIIRCLIRPDSLLIFDEATSNLDEQTEKIFLELLKKKNDRIVITTSHRDSYKAYSNSELKFPLVNL